MSRKALSLLLALLTAALPLAADILWFRQDFESAAIAAAAQGEDAACGRWEGVVAPHAVLEDADGHGKALRITRVGSYRAFNFSGLSAVPEGVNYRYSFDVKLDIGQKCYCAVQEAGGKRLTGVSMVAGGKVQTSPTELSWVRCGLTMPTGWVRIEVEVDRNEGSYTVFLTGEDGERHGSTPAALMGRGAPARLLFGTVLPQDTNCLVDNIEFRYDRHSPLGGRRNVLEGSSEATADDGLRLVKMAALAEASTLRVENLQGAAVTVQGLNAMGQWQTICDKAAADDEGALQIDFAPTRLSALKTDAAPDAALALYAPAGMSRFDADAAFQALVTGEFYLPVYPEGPADLHLFSTSEADIPVTVTLKPRDEKAGDDALWANLPVVLHTGENVVNLPLPEKMPAGEYVAHVVEDAERHGGLRRLLRYEPRQEAPKCADGTDMRGATLFFPDGHYFAQSSGIAHATAVAEIYKASKDHTTPGNVAQYADGIAILDGKLAVAYHTNDNYFHTNSIRKYYTTASLDDLSHWSEPVEGTMPKEALHPGAPLGRPGRRDDRWAKPGPDGKVHYRLYDPDRDGPADLSQIEIYYVPWMLAGTSGGADLPDFEGVTPVRRYTWPLWNKAPGEGYVMTKEPLLTDGLSSAEFESPADSNDNFAGQWLSDDGKTLYYVRGRILRRYPPYNVPFDNGSNIVRMLTVFKTTDGVHYERRAIALPDHLDVPGTQHYGARIFKVEGGHGLLGAYVMRYFARDQRIALELAYSWDGLDWERFSGRPPFADNGGHDDFHAGYIGAPADAITYGGKTYILPHGCSNVYHLIAELIWDRPDQATMPTATVQAYYENSRDMTKWPLFKRFKDWDELADRLRNPVMSAAVLVIRKDGYFCAEAGPEGGSFTTVPLRLAGTLAVNAETADGGSLKLEVVRPDGSVAAIVATHGDLLDKPLLKDLRDGIYSLRVTLKNAKLYTISCK